jgi:hypothetical protein
VWNLLQTRGNLKRNASERLRLLFLSDHPILINHDFNSFAYLLIMYECVLIQKTAQKRTSTDQLKVILFHFSVVYLKENNPVSTCNQYPLDDFYFNFIDALYFYNTMKFGEAF